ncbi:MAG TPA: aromatic ring-hydroxylating dioxygenase subunit alpha [Burkholderiaceae bacterium]|nr:aromatic ring-hydroxylating dioxygenase subunit alpha [Burkholderiaceae bacterium]
MNRETFERVLAESADTLHPVASARHSPSAIYTDPAFLELEREHVFFKEWLCCGRAESFERPGDYSAFDLLGEPVVIARGTDGKLTAFSNTCLHRAVRVVEPGTGNRRAFSCPFHGWTYDLGGRLLLAPRTQETAGFDVRSFRLPQIRVEDWHGWLFINFDPDAAPLSEHVRTLERDFAYLQHDECRLAITSVNDVECNWKLVVENLIDLYHVNVVHKTTNGRQFTSDAFRFAPREDGGYYATFNSGPSTLTGQPVFGPMPWMHDRPADFAATGRLRPTFTLFVRIDTIHASVTWPLSPTRSRITTYTLLPKRYFDEPDFEARVVAYRDYQNKVVSEDKAVLQMMQQGLSSRMYRPGRMAAGIEQGVHHVEVDNLNRLRAIASAAR